MGIILQFRAISHIVIMVTTQNKNPRHVGNVVGKAVAMSTKRQLARDVQGKDMSQNTNTWFAVGTFHTLTRMKSPNWA